jgi:hypothetical protein
VVVFSGVTILDPVKATLPIPWSMLTAVAPETFHVSVEEAPAEMPGGLASKELITGKSVVNCLQPSIRVTAIIREGQNRDKIFFIARPPDNTIFIRTNRS